MCRAVLQIFVEIERARLTRRLATIREAEGNINEAAEILQEVAVVSAGRNRDQGQGPGRWWRWWVGGWGHHVGAWGGVEARGLEARGRRGSVGCGTSSPLSPCT